MLRHRINVGRHHIQRIGPVGLFNYSDYLQNTYPQLDRLDMQESSGSAAAWNASASLPDASHIATTVGVPTNFGNLDLSVSYNGATSLTNYYSAALNAKFNQNAGTIICWFNVANWTDGVTRQLVELDSSSVAVDRVQLKKAVANNRFDTIFRAQSITNSINISGLTSTDWMMIALTWEKATANEEKIFINDSQVGGTQTPIGLWSNPLLSTACVLGALSTGATNVWNDDITRFMFGYTAEPLATIQDIYNKGAGI